MRPTVLRISVGALVRNAEAIRDRIPRNVKMLCVVKADAYGHGALRYAKMLEEAGIADAFAVALVEEARELREGGIRGMIVVLGAACGLSLKEAVRLGVSQAVDTPEALLILQEEAGRVGTKARAHLKVDSGMARIGVRTNEDLAELLKVWQKCPDVLMEGFFTHFCAADSDAEFTVRQSRLFEDMLTMARNAGYNPLVHAAATSAMLDGRFQYDMVRAGIGLYGSCLPELSRELRHAQTLSTRPIHIGRLKKGETVGYGRTFRAERDTVVMTLPIGYGDGYPRSLSGRAEVLVHGKRVPVIGRVCMDMLMADITDIPDVTLSDEVVLMGCQGNERITPDELAGLAQTIPYEIMLGWHPRIRRVFED